MSYFSDFDDFLKRQEEQKKQNLNDHRNNVLKSRKDASLLLEDLLTVFKEFNEKIIQPRKPHFVILKKHEELPKFPDNDPYFLYRVNVIPKDLYVAAYDPNLEPGENHLKSGKITKHDWHPHVAMQYDIAFFDTTVDKKQTGLLQPTVIIKVWGNINQKALISPFLNLSVNHYWGRDYTQAKIQNLNEQQLKEDTVNVLTAFTPKIFEHHKEVLGLDI